MRGPGQKNNNPNKLKPKNAKKTLKRLLGYVGQSKKFVFFLLSVVVIITGCQLLQQVIQQQAISSINYEESTINASKFINCLIILVISYIVAAIMQYFQQLLGAIISLRTVKNLRNDLFAKIVKLPISYVDSHPHGDIMSRMTNDVSNVADAVSQSIASLLSGVLIVIGCFVIMFVYSPLLTLIAVSTVFLTILLSGLISKLMKKLFVKQQALLGQLNTQTEEMVGGFKTVTAYNKQEKVTTKFNAISDDLCKTGMKAQIISGSMGPVMNFIGNFGYFLICFFGAYFVIKNIGKAPWGSPLDASVIVLFITCSKQFTRPINEIAQLFAQIMTALAGAERVFEIMDEPDEIDNPVKDIEVKNIKGTIDFKNVCFSYQPGKPIITNFNLDIRAGHKIALVGSTGSGKTTIVNLLMRFYELNSGDIYIDDVNIKDIPKKTLRESIAIVLQDSVLFNDTIENNIKYGKADATTEEFEQALLTSNSEKFIKRLPQQEKTVLTDEGGNLSQGQRQLITITRAVLADPKILILDEATSSVDTRTEKRIQNAMINLMKNRTSIIIAHRLSTIQDADLIVVMDHGQVVEMGNHEQLLEKKGVYNKLYQTQFSGLST